MQNRKEEEEEGQEMVILKQGFFLDIMKKLKLRKTQNSSKI